MIEKIEWISSFNDIVHKYKYFIFDCDGVIWNANFILNENVAFIKSLMHNSNCFFLSNTNKNSRQDLQKKLLDCGLEIEIKRIFTSSYLISNYISHRYPSLRNIFLIGSDGLKSELEKKGFKIYGGPKNEGIKLKENFSYSDIPDIEVDENIEAVVCGYDDKFNYFKICYASEIIRKTGLFFGTNYDNKVKIKNKFAPGSYTFISAIETCTEVKAQIITKPDPRSLDIIFEENNLEITDELRTQILMIGDNLNTDILFGNNNRIDSLLLLTGVSSEEDVNRISETRYIPTYILKLK